MLGKLFGVDELKEELLKSQDKIQMLENRLQIKERSIDQLQEALTKLENKNKALLDENDRIKGHPNHFGRSSRASDQHMKLLKMFQSKGLSYSEIGIKMTKFTDEKWSKSTVHYLLTR